MQGKIIKGIGGFYYVHDGIGKVYECRAKGIFRNRGIKPLVGDDVEISILDEEKATGNLDEILPRKNRLIRPAVSNVDQAVVVFAITDPMPNLNLLDRFLVMMERQEVPVSICFNKIDLVDAAEQEKLRAIYEPAGYPVHFISTYEKSGLEEFQIPPISILTFVENSVRYLHPEERIPEIRIHIRRLTTEQESMVNICIMDNGSGFDAEMLEKLNASEEKLSNDHIGIKNVQQRFQLIYGESVPSPTPIEMEHVWICIFHIKKGRQTILKICKKMR